MIDHIGFPVSDYDTAKAFYLKALAPLGYSLVMEVTQEQTGDHPAAGFGANGKPDFWISGEGGIEQAAACRDPRQGTAPPSMRSTRPRSPPAAATMARPASARIIIRIITAPSCSIPTATTSKPFATRRITRFRTAPLDARNIVHSAPLSLNQEQYGAKS